MPNTARAGRPPRRRPHRPPVHGAAQARRPSSPPVTYAVVEAAPAEWGWWSIIHLPTALILLFVGFLLLEMLRSIWSYNQPTLVGSKVFEMFSGMLK